MSRRADRHGEQPEVRIRMLEDDMDRVDDQIVHSKNTARTLIESLRVEFTEKLAGLRETLSKDAEEARAEAKEAKAESAGQRKLLVGILISVMTIAIGIALQVLVFRGGPT